MQSVFSKMPAYDTTLKKWAVQEIYGWADPSGGTATLSFVADSFYTLDILTPGGRCFNITFFQSKRRYRQGERKQKNGAQQRNDSMIFLRGNDLLHGKRI